MLEAWWVFPPLGGIREREGDAMWFGRKGSTTCAVLLATLIRNGEGQV